MPRGKQMDESAKIKALCEMMATCESFCVNPTAMADFFDVESTRTIHRKLDTMVRPYGYELKRGRMRKKKVEKSQAEDEDEEDDEEVNEDKDEEMAASESEEDDDDDDDMSMEEAEEAEEAEEVEDDVQGEEEPVLARKEDGEMDNDE